MGRGRKRERERESRKWGSRSTQMLHNRYALHTIHYTRHDIKTLYVMLHLSIGLHWLVTLELPDDKSSVPHAHSLASAQEHQP